nr:unnamed protein product [Callosobruchus analis]
MSETTNKRLERSSDPDVWMKWYNEISSDEESPMDEEDEDGSENDNLENRQIKIKVFQALMSIQREN